jgi:hypothetical protein
MLVVANASRDGSSTIQRQQMPAFGIHRRAVTAIAIQFIESDGSILQIDATAQLLHIDKDRAIALRLDLDVPEALRDAGSIRGKQYKLLM